MTDAIKAKLSVEYAGVKLGLGLVEVVTDFLVEVAKVKDVNEFKVQDLLETATEAWKESAEGAALPSVHVKAIKLWLLKAIGRKEGKSAALVGDEYDSDEEDDSLLFGSKSPTARDLAKLNDDKDNQRLTGVRILRLALALELGRVPAVGEVVGSFCYNSDPRVADIVKAQRKAGIPTLAKILEGAEDGGNDFRLSLNMHFAGLQREYSEEGLVQEASLVTQMWAEAQAVSFDDKVLRMYLREYFKKYAGRGIPVTVDVLIATRVAGSREASAVTRAQFDKVVGQVVKTNSELVDARQMINRLQTRLQKLETGKKAGSGAFGGLSEVVCHKCGEKGHIAKNCPNKKKGEEKEPDPEAEE